jgi:hypothetical protein
MNEVSHSLDRVAAATDRVLVTATALSDARAPWLLGRGDGATLTVAGGGALPALPPWR